MDIASKPIPFIIIHCHSFIHYHFHLISIDTLSCCLYVLSFWKSDLSSSPPAPCPAADIIQLAFNICTLHQPSIWQGIGHVSSNLLPSMANSAAKACESGVVILLKIWNSPLTTNIDVLEPASDFRIPRNRFSVLEQIWESKETNRRNSMKRLKRNTCQAVWLTMNPSSKDPISTRHALLHC